MLVPLNWLKDYIKTNKNTGEIAHSFTMLGLLLDKPVDKVNEIEVLDLEHRMDRADWLSILGCARDLAAFENIELIKPELDDTKYPQIPEDEQIAIDIEESDGFVNRFYTRVIKNVEVKESPEWLKERLEAYGIPARNNIVDITNFVMVEYGQPMHAHDLDLMETKNIGFRKAHNGEKITTLLGEDIILDESVFIMVNNNKPTAVGGIVGGSIIAINENTRNIVLDSGNYDQTKIRKASRKLKIQNETVLRNDKFLHPYNNEIAVKRATKLILELCGPNVEVYENEDFFPNKEKWQPKQMVLRFARLKKVGGVDISKDEVKQRLTNLEYKVLEENESGLLMQVPHFRTDVEVEDDMVADILRIGDYSKIPQVPVTATPPKEITPAIYKYENKLRDILVRMEAHEHITDTLVEYTGVKGEVKLENALSSDKSALRTTIYETLKPVLNVYKKHKFIEATVFEIGNTYHLKGHDTSNFDHFEEIRTLEIIVGAPGEKPYALNKKVKTVLATFMHELGVENVELDPVTQNKAQILVGGKAIGELNIDSITIYTERLMEIEQKAKRVTNIIPNEMTEDITVPLNKGLTGGQIHNKILNYHENIDRVEVIKEFTKEDGAKLVTYRVHIQNDLDTKNFAEEITKQLTELKKELGVI